MYDDHYCDTRLYFGGKNKNALIAVDIKYIELTYILQVMGPLNGQKYCLYPNTVLMR